MPSQNLFPVQIEDAMTRHPAILEAAAVSVPDAQFGEVVGAWVVRQPNVTISRQEVRKCVSDNMNPQVSKPQCIFFIVNAGTSSCRILPLGFGL